MLNDSFRLSDIMASKCLKHSETISPPTLPPYTNFSLSQEVIGNMIRFRPS